MSARSSLSRPVGGMMGGLADAQSIVGCWSLVLQRMHQDPFTQRGPIEKYVVCGFFAVCFSATYLSHPFFMWCLLPHSVHSRFSRRSAATGHLPRQWLVFVPGMSSHVQEGAGGGPRAPRRDALPLGASSISGRGGRICGIRHR